jgi:hypothetical protein
MMFPRQMDLTPRAQQEGSVLVISLCSLRIEKQRLNPASSRNQGQVNTLIAGESKSPFSPTGQLAMRMKSQAMVVD